MIHHAFRLVDELAKNSLDVGIVDFFRIKPVNEKLLLSYVGEAKLLITLEEHSINGGIGSIICEILADNGKRVPVKRFAIQDKDCFQYGDREWMYSYFGLDVGALLSEIMDTLQTISINGVSNTGRIDNFAAENENDNKIYDLGIEEFAKLFGLSIQDFSEECRAFISETDFHYKYLSEDEKEKVVLESLRRMSASDFSESGPHRKKIWEKGWSENLAEFESNNYNLQSLVPKFVRTNTVKRLCSNYIIPSNPEFETAFVSVMRKVLFGKYFSEANSIYEFGCGTGLNLVELAELYPDKNLYGLDWAQASCEIVRKIAQSKNLKIEPILFDMYDPDYQVNVTPADAVFTIGAMEQLGTHFDAFLGFLLKKKPLICINFETMNEIYTNETLCDYVTIEYTKKRKYLFGYLDKLKSLEKRGFVKIFQVERTFGGQYHEGYSFVVWKPL